MTGFDYAVLGVCGLSLGLGLWRGFVREVFALISWAAAFWLARQFGPMAADLFTSLFSDPLAQGLAGYALIFIGVMLLSALMAALIRMMLSAVGLGPADRFLGGVFGALRGALISLLCVLLAGLTPLPAKPWWQEATFAPPLETAVLAAKPWLPAGLASRLRYPLR